MAAPNRKATTNMERMYQGQYRAAHKLLTEDPEAAEQAFTQLLEAYQIPLWMRVQCNCVLSGITVDANDAERYLTSAKTCLKHFTKGRPRPDPLENDISGMREHFEELESRIEARRQEPWVNEDIPSKVEEVSAGMSKLMAAVPGEDPDEMLFGHTAQEEQEILNRASQQEQDDAEMLLGDESGQSIGRDESSAPIVVETQQSADDLVSDDTVKAGESSQEAQSSQTSLGEGDSMHTDKAHGDVHRPSQR